MAASPARAAAPALSDAALSALLTSRHFDELARYDRDHRQRPEEQTPLRLVVICSGYIYLADFEAAQTCLDRLEQVIAGGARATSYGTVTIDWQAKPYYMRAEILLTLGDYPAAAAMAERGMAVVRATGPHIQRDTDQMLLLQERGLANGFAGHPDLARRDAEAMAHAVTLDGDAKRAALGPLLRLGRARVFAAINDFPAAAHELAEPDANLETFVAQAVDQSYLRLGIGYLKARALLEQDRLPAAEAAYRALLAEPRIEASGDILWPARFDAGRIAGRTGHPEEAIAQYRQAIAVIERQRATIHGEAARIGFVGNKQAVYAALVSALVAGGRAGEALEVAERAKARALVDLLAGRKSFAPRPGNAATVPGLLDELDRLDRTGAALPGAGPEPRAGASRGLARVRDDLAVAAPALAPLVTVMPVAVSALQARLGPDETLVEYFMGDDPGDPRLYAFVASPDAVVAVTLDGRGLTDAVRQFRQSIEAQHATDGEARALYDRLIAPLAQSLGHRPDLTIVPHGPLHYLPFSALRGPDGLLIESRRLRFLPSAGVLAFLGRHDRPPPRTLLVLGDPDLGDPRFDLPGALAEARAVAETWPDATVVLRERATRAVVETTGDGYRMLHVASHGQFNPERPLASRLLLAGRSPDAGQLTANDLYDLRLDADLVTLSACETGLGRVESGDDVIGLTRGFLYAGARSIVASLWQVSDDATRDLMIAFYQALHHTGPAEALRQAQLATRAKYPDPTFWSAFQVTGASDW